MLERVQARSGALRHRRHLNRLTGVGAAALVVVLAVVVAIAVPVGDNGAEPNRPTATTTTTTTQPVVCVVDLTGEWRPVSIAGYAGPLTSPPLGEVPRLFGSRTTRSSGTTGATGSAPASSWVTTVRFVPVSSAPSSNSVPTPRRCRTRPPGGAVELRNDRVSS